MLIPTPSDQDEKIADILMDLISQAGWLPVPDKPKQAVHVVVVTRHVGPIEDE